MVGTTTKKAELLEAFGVSDITTPEMDLAIHDWFNLYYGTTGPEEDGCQRIAYTVVNKLTKTAFSEYTASTKKKDEFCSGVLDVLDRKKKRIMQTMLIGGEAWIKPYPTGNRFNFSIIRRDSVFVFGRDEDGVPTDIGSIEKTTIDKNYYTLCERRINDNGILTIENKLYESDTPGTLGHRVPLKTLSKYEQYPDTYTYSEPLGLGLVYLKVPMENAVDGSVDGCSVYAAAAKLIHNIDHNEWLLNNEFDTGQRRLIVSDDMLDRKPGTGKTRTISATVFVGLDGGPEEVGITEFSPALREQSYLARKMEYLRNVENLIGIKRGLLSEVEAQERTAKEITSSEGDYNLTIGDLQDVWTQAVEDTIELCSALARVYGIDSAAHSADDLIIDYGNGVLFDEEKTWQGYLDMVARGLLKPEIAVGWRFGMPTETEADLAAVRAKYMPTDENLIDEEGAE